MNDLIAPHPALRADLSPLARGEVKGTLTRAVGLAGGAGAGKTVEGEVLGREATVRVIGRPHLFKQDRIDRALPAGLTVAELLEEAIVAYEVAGGRRVAVNRLRVVLEREGSLAAGEVVPPALWAKVRPKPGVTVSFRAVPQGGGGGGIFRTVLTLAIVAAAAIAAPYLATALFPTLTGTALSLVTSAIGFGLVTIGTLLLNALFPVRPPKLSDDSGGTNLNSIAGAQNTATPWDPVPLVLGRHRQSPVYGAGTYTEIVGDDQYLRALFVWGYGPLLIEDIKLGETPIGEFDGVEIETRQGYADDAPITLYVDEVFQDNIDVRLSAGDGTASDNGPGDWALQVTAPDVDELSVDLLFPGGLYKMDDGKKKPNTAYFSIQYRLVGDSGWLGFDGAAAKSEQREQVKPFRLTFRQKVERGQYEIRARKDAGTEEKTTLIEEIHWIAVRGTRNEAPLRNDRPLAITAVRIKATDQLNGTINTLNGVVTSILPDWDPSASPPQWVERATQNPAAMFRAALQGPAIALPLADERLDLARLQDWHEYCTAQGFAFNQVRTSAASVRDTLADIASSGRAVPTLIDGKWGVIRDDADRPVVQVFTPRNSWGFSSTRAYRDLPHALRVRFIDEDNSWQEDERIVYDDGYDKAGEDGNIAATKFEGVEFPGVTKSELIWRHGRFHIAQVKLQPDDHTLNTDFESLRCTKGDKVLVQSEVLEIGLSAGRVKQVDAETLTVVLDEYCPMVDGTDYAIRFRLASGDTLLLDVVNAPGERKTLTLVADGSSPQTLPAPGDLFAFGVKGVETAAMIVKAIARNDDVSAQLTLVDDAPGISAADQGTIPPFESSITAPVDLRGRIPPSDLRVSEALYRTANAVEALVSLSWQRPPVLGAVQYEVQYKQSGLDWQPGGVTLATDFRFVNLDGGSYSFRVRTLGPNGVSSAWLVLSSYTVKGLLAPPADVTNFRVSMVGALAALSWDAVPDLDLDHYEIRFTPELTGQLWQNAIVLVPSAGHVGVQVPAMVGTWMIKAVDSSGIYSVNAALIVSTVAAIEGLNAVEVIDEAAGSPAFAGIALPESDNVALDEDVGGLRLADVDVDVDDDNPQIEGTYYFAGSLDLGDVYTSRLSATVLVRGFDTTESFLDYPNVLAVADILGAGVADYQVELEYRATSSDPAGSPPGWGPWTAFLVGDVTARAFQFRARLYSYRRGVTPLLTGLAVTVDMPDRIASANDVSVGTGGLDVTYDPPFRAKPSVAVSIQDAATGDYYVKSGESESGFHIVFKNAAGTTVARTFDWVARGYGKKLA